MNDAKYIGLDVHQATISVAVRNSGGKLVMEAILETKAETMLQFVRGLRGSLHVTFEEGTCAAWLYALLKPHVTQVLVCDPRKNALLKVGNKSDRIDARKLAELLRANLLSSVFHEDTGLRTLKELARSYLTVNKDLTEAGVRRRAEIYYQQLDALRFLHQQARKELLGEGRKHSATKLLRQIPSIGPIRAVRSMHMLGAVVDTGCLDCDLGKLRRDILQQGRGFLLQVDIEEGGYQQASHPHHSWTRDTPDQGFPSIFRQRKHGFVRGCVVGRTLDHSSIAIFQTFVELFVGAVPVSSPAGLN
jgi:hypothetical protein